MKNKILLRGLMVAFVALTLACNQKKEEVVVAPTIDKEEVKAEIQAVEDAFAANYNSRDVASLTYYADDATSYFNGKMPLVGKEAIHQSIKEELASLTKGEKMTFVTNEVYVTNDGNDVLEIGSYHLADSTGAKLASGNYMSLFEKRDGKYQCIRDMGNSDSTSPEN